MDLEAIVIGREHVLERHVRAGTFAVEAEPLGSLAGVHDDAGRIGCRLETPVRERDGVTVGKHEPMTEKRVARRNELHGLSRIARGEGLVLQQLGGN